MNKIIHRWHTRLDMPKHDAKWHEQDIADEMQELEEARGIVNNWSELSDISYTYTRAHWSGHENIKLPIGKVHYYIGLVYMFPKYYLRWSFFNAVGKKLDGSVKVREVRNPKKINKLHTIAEKYGFDKDEFSAEAKRLMRRRIFLK